MTTDLTHDCDRVFVHLCMSDVTSLADLARELDIPVARARKAVAAIQRRGLCTGLDLDNTGAAS